MLLTHVSILGSVCLKDSSHSLSGGWKIERFVAHIMLRLMNCGQLLTICWKLSMALIVHVIAKFMFLLLMLVVRLTMKCFLESPRYGKTLCARKMSLCNGINNIVYSVNVINVINVVSIYCHCVPRKPRDLMTMWSLGGDLFLDKLCQWQVNHKRNLTLYIMLFLLMSLMHIWSLSFNILCTITLLLIGGTCNLDCVWDLCSWGSLYLWLILQKNISLQFRMRYNWCIGIFIKFQFWSTLPIVLTLIGTWMMHIHIW